MVKVNVEPFVEAAGRADHLLVVQDVEGGAVHRRGLALAPVPERAQDRGGASAQVGAAGDAPRLLGVFFLRDGRGKDRALARLLEPAPALQTAEFRLQDFRDAEEVVGVVHRVIDHLLRQRTQRPVGFLRSLRDLQAEVALEQRGEAELRDAAQARRDHRVEDAPGGHKAAATEQPQIVVHSVNDEFLPREGGEERLQRIPGERVDQQIVARHADLDEAELLEVAVEAVRLGIDGDARMRCERGQRGCKGLGGIQERLHQPRSPVSSSSAFVFVALSAWMSTSVASTEGSAES